MRCSTRPPPSPQQPVTPSLSSGNGYAFLSLWRSTGDAQYLDMARAFAVFAADRWEELQDAPDRPASLFEVTGGGGASRTAAMDGLGMSEERGA